MEHILYMRLRSGDTLIGTKESETEEHLKMVALMDVNYIERDDYTGIMISPTIPFGVSYKIPINKADILFKVEPPSILTKLYKERVRDALELVIEYLKKEEEAKTIRNRHLH
jgi:hypothetical protein